MAYARRYGLDEMRYVHNPLVELAMRENTAPSTRIDSQLDLPDSMSRYQEELLNSRVPERRPRDDEQGGEEEVRERSRKIMNIHQYGDVRGDMDVAYQPEIEQVPQPYRKLNENKYHIFQRDKQIHARYGWRGEAQKDAIMQSSATDPKYRHADTRKYIPGYIRTMPKTTIEDKVVPMYERGRFCKPIQNYRNVENVWMLQYCKDKTDTSKVKRKIERHRKPSARPEVDPLPDDTNINMIYTFVSGKYEKTGALKPLAQGAANDDSIAKFERKRQKPKGTGYINTGAIMEIDDLLEIREKVANIQRAVKKATQRRPTLDYAVTEVSADGTKIKTFEKKRPSATKSNAKIIIRPSIEGMKYEDDKVENMKEKEKRKPWKQNRKTGYEPTQSKGKMQTFKKELPKLTRATIRNFMNESDVVMEDTANTSEKYHKTRKNIDRLAEGHDLTDETQQTDISHRKLAEGVPEYRLGRVDESIAYDDKVAYITSENFTKKARNEQYRNFNPDAIIVETEPIAQINTRAPLVNVTSDDKKHFVVSEYMMRRNLSDEL